MRIDERTHAGISIVRLEGEFDSASAPAVEARLQALSRGERPHIVLEMSGVPFMTSAGIRVLQLTARTAKSRSGDLLLAGLTKPISNVLLQTGLLAIFRVFPDLQAALIDLDVPPIELEAVSELGRSSSQTSDGSMLEQHIHATLIAGADRAALNFEKVPYLANRAIRDHVRSEAEALGADPDALNEVLVALDEALTNIVLHGYKGQEDGVIEIIVERDQNDLVVRLFDEAPIFDPTLVDPPDLSLSLEERPIGGLGVHLIRHNIDQITHRPRSEGGNELTLVKRRALISSNAG